MSDLHGRYVAIEIPHALCADKRGRSAANTNSATECKTPCIPLWFRGGSERLIASERRRQKA